MTQGPDFYDQEHVFATYMQRRERSDSPNDTLEKPIIMELIGDVHGADVLDLGCGDGRFGVELLAAGCQSYTGVEASNRMVEKGEQRLKEAGGILHHATIESWPYPTSAYDLVVSRLALHYLADLQQTFEQVHKALKPGGLFVFSVEHPVISSCDRAIRETGIRQAWIVDDYFDEGERNVAWMNSEVIKYHRTIENYFLGLQKAQFMIESLRESAPQKENFNDDALYARRKRIPLFLLLKARRSA